MGLELEEDFRGVILWVEGGERGKNEGFWRVLEEG